MACFAIDAMEHGRRLLWARRHRHDWSDPGPDGLQVLRDGLPNDVVAQDVVRMRGHRFASDANLWPRILVGRLDILTAVSNLAATRFWCHLHDFAAAHLGWCLCVLCFFWPPGFGVVPPFFVLFCLSLCERS